MIFELPEETRHVRDEMARWAERRIVRVGEFGTHDPADWAALAEFGLFHGTRDEMRDLDVATAMLTAARGGLPGPVLEAELAVASGSKEADRLLREGRFVSSVQPGSAGSVLVGWGAAAELVVDQGTGQTLLDGPAEPVETALAMAHGRVERPAGDADPLAARRWMLGAALLTGLGTGAVRLASEHVKAREQFGRTLSSFQAVQFRLAEASLALESAELAVLDAARRADARDGHATIAAALAWIYAAEVSEAVERHVHQVMGAIGFTEEMGVIRFTYQLAWLRTSVGRDDALALVDARRVGLDGTPPSVVLQGFAS